ncbi:cation diffusion facilitator family transporter [Marinicrinis lubricantis]|uniref:Cation diffusion facilitator family transporter n=1 Tax=Marinicrinis lubricantis TaxID=2086470 RepID=A0ABW1IVI0_9BACL
METYQDLKQGEKGAWVSIGAYLLLSAIKLGVGFYAASEALMADGWNNTTDIIASVAVLIGLRISRKPPDEDHPYGHFRAETISAMVASFVMAVVGIEVLWGAVRTFMDGTEGTPDPLAAWVALGSAVFMYGIYRYNLRLAKQINNQALLAAAQDNRSDAFVSVGALIGIVGAQFGAAWLDPLAACAVGLIILKTAWDIFRESSLTLTDGFDAVEEIEELSKCIETIAGVRNVKDVKARRHGNRVFLDATIAVSPQMSVKESHDITEKIERQLKKQYHINYAHIHIEPDEQQQRIT